MWFFELLSPAGVSLRHSFGKLKLPSSQATLLRVALFVERGALLWFFYSSPLRGAKSSSVYRGGGPLAVEEFFSLLVSFLLLLNSNS